MQKCVEILGSQWIVNVIQEKEDSYLKNQLGYCDDSTKSIVVKCEPSKEIEYPNKNFENVVNETLRHEIIHAFLSESGLKYCCNWASNEEMVDWLAVQIHKIFKVMRQIECIKEE